MQLDYKNEYARWCEAVREADMRAELESIAEDDAQQRERFGAELEFGTAGLRGILGAGTARMNGYTVRRATQGLADYVLRRNARGSVAIAYDSRHKSALFCRETACVLAANGVTVWLYDRLMPTPMLSFAVRKLKTTAGVMITASHNPAAYNGYKVYGADGCQMTLEDTREVSGNIARTELFSGVRTMDYTEAVAAGRIRTIGEDVIEDYYRAVLEQQATPGVCARHNVRVVFTPLNGTGNEPVRRVLDNIGVTAVVVVPEQELPDGNFPTCTYPNPEMREALELGLALCERERADLLLATDPDADRVGVALRDGDGYRILTGNETGALLLHYLVTARAQNGTLAADAVAVRSIVSTALADEIARDAGVEMRRVLTGFKYIGEQILKLEQNGEEKRFLFGFEESCGYLAGTYVRDKDAVVACMLLCEMAAACAENGTTPAAVLDGLYQRYGYYVNQSVALDFPGAAGGAEMAALMDRLFDDPPLGIAGFAVTAVDDYRAGVRCETATGARRALGLPAADVIGFSLENGAAVIVRPSGTEPKMKLYITAKEKTAAASAALIETLGAGARGMMGK